ncbi:hypothetical protein [Flavobacterium sp. C3NV]|uniref:hypothetical protein n=1 Tax=Flavobacterium sp. C3NV TaxID=3393358 RepID=UPI00398F99F8
MNAYKKVILLVFFILLSCKKNTKEIIQYDAEGKIVSKIYGNPAEFIDSIFYYKNGVIDSKMVTNKLNKLSFYVKYYDGKNIVSEGNTINKLKDNKWKYYNSKNKVEKVVEYKNICGEEYPNQEWNYDSKGNLDIPNSSFFSHTFKNSKFESKVKNELIIKYVPLIKKKGVISLIYFSPDFDNKFCNIDKIKKNGLKSSGNDISFKINISFKNKGKKYFRGYIEEHFYEDTNNKEVVNHKTRKVYIDIPIIVN